ncbi:MAG: hypothetical protein JKY96_02560 [Phycisphaerales bacterium]|nr:hypothetical protein [Phycisphaerales bacterium]
MKNQISTILVVAGLSLSVGTTTALAQVAPPPKPATTPTGAEQKATPQTAPAQQTTAVNQPQKPKRVNTAGDIPNVAHPPLAVKGEDGRIVRLRMLPDILALRSNPLVGPGSIDAIMPIIYGRRARFEMLTINNIDLYWELTAGALESLTLGDLTRMNEIAEMVKPLVGKTTLSEELTNRGILSRVQGKFNQKIVSDYKKAIGDEIQVLDGDDSLDEYLKFILSDSFHESRLAYRALLAELVTQVDEVVEKSGTKSSAVQSLLSYQSPLKDTKAETRVQLDAFDKVFRTLSVDDAISVLDAMRQMRTNPYISPLIRRIVVLREGKSIMKNFDLEIKKRGKVVKTTRGKD